MLINAVGVDNIESSVFLFIRPESDHCLPLSLTDSLNKLPDMTLASNFLMLLDFEVW